MLLWAPHATADTAITPDGGQFTGEMKEGLFHGQGKIVWPDGAIYEGDFKEDRFHGSGKLISRYDEYHGAFKDDEFWGYGSWKHKDGRRYQGEFVRGEFQGKGRFTTLTGEVYEGRFAKGEFVGLGKMTTPNNAYYEGEFSDWRFHGQGVFMDAEGNVYEGRFVQGKLNGPGKMVGKDGSRYEGEFVNSEYHGKGVYESKEGRYEGEFMYGRFHGTGIYRYTDPLEDGSFEHSGLWRYGQYVDEAAEKQTSLNVETALYKQPELLASALRDLKVSDPENIDMYFLAIGGDGAQEVFRRETEFVKAQFESRFGVGGRAIHLVNSRTTVSEKPMATITSLRKSVKAIAAKMDKENDILFLFMTSHGSRSHDFVLDQNGMDLPDLSAQELGDILKDSGIKWKVLVISACFSGGFIDYLQDDYSLIITAAARDRASFGCRDENEFTYFGKAFFAQALPSASSFEAAFEKAKVIIHDREKEDFFGEGSSEEPLQSNPQIHRPQAIMQHLKRWREQSEVASIH